MLDLVLHHRRPDPLRQAVGEGENRQAAEHGSAVPEEPAGDRPAGRHAPEARSGEEQPPGRDENRDPEHRRRPAHQVKQPQGPETAESRAEQIDPVDHADREGAAGQGEADHDPGEEERQRERDGELGPDDERHGRGGQARDDGQLHQQGQDGCQGEAERCGAQVKRQLLRSVPLRAKVDPDRSGGEAEHRDADDEEGEVIPGRDGDDPGLDDLQHQGRRGDHAEACIERQPLRKVLQPLPPVCRRGDRVRLMGMGPDA
jgi:hypothetical protein